VAYLPKLHLDIDGEGPLAGLSEQG
jgi:hypothetical protein